MSWLQKAFTWVDHLCGEVRGYETEVEGVAGEKS